MTGANVSPSAALRRALVAIDQLRSKVDAYRDAEREPIAIVGMGCRFAGDANSPDGYWELLRNGVDAISEVPRDRWDLDTFYSENADAPGKMYCPYGGFLRDIYGFDADFFGIAPREATRMDPQQRIFLEVAWEALEHAGIVPTELGRSATGVFVGVSLSDYGILQFSQPDLVDTYTPTGTVLSIIPNRLSYVLDLRGPSMAIDTACSSALVAVHDACRSLRARECNLAIAGGISIIIAPGVTIGMSKLRALAPDGRCKTFDARANGYVRGEGCGIVVLKRLSDAQAAGDPIAAVIRGSAVHNEGRRNGLTAPSGVAQQALFRQALAGAGVEPSQVCYIEAHGTGTPLGDPIEVGAIAPVYGALRDDGIPCMLGSVKTNIGHLEPAAGIAGLIKVALCLKNRAVVPTLHFNSLNPHISLDGTRLRIATTYQPWPNQNVPFLAAVSSFGIGGTIAHAILEEPPRHARSTSSSLATPTAPSRSRPYLLSLSARDPAALRALVEAFQHELARGPHDAFDLGDICYTTSLRRAHHDHRLAVVGDTPSSMIQAFTSFLAAEAPPNVAHGQCRTDGSHRIVFVFPGQGSQWVGMGRRLLPHEPIFRQTLEACSDAVRSHAGWSVLDEIQADEAASHLDRLDVVQPCIFAIQVALAAHWRAYGIHPAAVIGHSMGEVAAAHVAGALDLHDAVQVICDRSRIAREHLSGRGGMAVVELSSDDLQQDLAGHGGRIGLAAINGPASSVLSGESNALDVYLEHLASRGIFGRRVKVDYASHSPQVEPIKPLLRQALAQVRAVAPNIPFYSTVTGARIDGNALDADYWVRNLRDPVLFWPIVRALVNEGMETFLEISPHPVLTGTIADSLHHIGVKQGTCLESLRRDQDEHTAWLTSFARLYTLGFPVNFQRLYQDRDYRLAPLPGYPWQRSKYWLPEMTSSTRLSPLALSSSHPILRLGGRLHASTGEKLQFWEFSVGTDLLPYWTDHRVGQSMVFPSTAYLEIALAAAGEGGGNGMLRIDDAVFEEPLVLPEQGSRTLQAAFMGDLRVGAQFRISVQDHDTSDWKTLTTGRIQVRDRTEGNTLPAQESISTILQRCGKRISKEEHYRRAHARRIHYGPAFQGIATVWCGEDEVLAQIEWPDALHEYAENYTAHPAVMDACLQSILHVLGSAPDSGEQDATWLPVSLRTLCRWARLSPGSPLWAYGRRVGVAASTRELTSDILVLDGEGNVLVEMRGLGLQRVDKGAEAHAENCLYAIMWQEHLTAATAPADTSGIWLLLTDGGSCGNAFAEIMGRSGATCIVTRTGKDFQQVEPDLYEIDAARPEHFRRLIDEICNRRALPLRGVLSLLGLDTPALAQNAGDVLDGAIDLACITTLHLVQAFVSREDSPPRLWLVTQRAQAVLPGEDVAVDHAPLWGLRRVIGAEHPELRCTCVDLEGGDPREQAAGLFGVLWHDEREHEIALRGKRRFVPRLVHHAVSATSKAAPPITMKPGQDAFRLELSQPGLLELSLVASRRREPGPGEVEIAVRAAGLNFRDVLKALGQYPGLPQGELPLGDECAGVVTAVGDGVGDRLKVGDEVIAMASGRAFSSFVIARADQVVVKPRFITFEQAATIPVAFLTAWFALAEQARLQSGERVLIHAAAGGVGLAALQIAQELGAQVYATAGSPEKRALLHALGMEHVFDSRSLAFVQGVQNATNGQGVDVVLNSLAGDFIPASLSLLRPFGRFIEIGKKDIYANTRLGLSPFQRNLSLTMLDLELIARERPSRFAEIFRDVMQRFADKRFSPICRHVFPISRATEGFQFMAHARHSGKIALSFDEAEVPVCAAPGGEVVFRPDATYLITGGLGGLGLVVARWMAEHGARHLALMGRRGPTGQAQQAVSTIKAMGVEVRIVRGDVSVDSDVQRVLSEVDGTMPALRGIIHAAGVLQDATLLNADRATFRAVLAPKVAGAWNLHLLTRDRSLDHFVLFASLAGVLGTAGQGNYAAANAFLDGLAWHRRALGLPAMSIDWGSWSDVGLAAADAKRGERLAGMGVTPMSPARALEAFGRILQQDNPQVVIAQLDAARWSALNVADASDLLATLARSEGQSMPPASQSTTLREKLLAVDPSFRASLLATHLKAELATVLHLRPSQIRETTPFRSMGMDSLTSLDFRNRVESILSVRLSVATVWSHPTISQLVIYLADKLEVSLTHEAKSVRAAATIEPIAKADLEDLSGEELMEQLDQKLSELDIAKVRKP